MPPPRPPPPPPQVLSPASTVNKYIAGACYYNVTETDTLYKFDGVISRNDAKEPTIKFIIYKEGNGAHTRLKTKDSITISQFFNNPLININQLCNQSQSYTNKCIRSKDYTKDRFNLSIRRKASPYNIFNKDYYVLINGVEQKRTMTNREYIAPCDSPK